MSLDVAGYRWPAIVAALSFTAFGMLGVARGNDRYQAARAAHPDLFQAYYDEGVMEYCGLQTRESMGGFFLRRDELLAAGPVSSDAHRDVRIAALAAVELEHEDRGLSGQKNWCKTEGLDAYNRFVERFRAKTGAGQTE